MTPGLRCVWLVGCALLLQQPAAAEIGASVSLSNDDRFRGSSVSDGRPVAGLSLSYDDLRGPYVGATVSVAATTGAGLRFNSSVQYIGYAQHITIGTGSGFVLDAGVTHRMYSRRSDVEYLTHFVEGYVGIVGRRLSSRIYYAPSYDAHGDALYSEIDANLVDREPWSLSAHLGLLLPPRETAYDEPSAQPDWRLTAAMRQGRLDLSVSYIGAGRNHDQPNGRRAVVISVTRNF